MMNGLLLKIILVYYFEKNMIDNHLQYHSFPEFLYYDKLFFRIYYFKPHLLVSCKIVDIYFNIGYINY